MRPGTKRPLRQRSNESAAQARSQVAKTEAADARAQRRFHCARFVRETEGSLRERHRALLDAISDPDGALHDVIAQLGENPATFTVSLDTVQRWVTMPHDAVSILALQDRPRSGRPLEALAPELQQCFDALVKGVRPPSVRQLYLDLAAEAAAHGLEAPSYDRVKRLYNDVPHIQHVAAEHGTRAAVADASVHGSPAPAMPHEMWALDEATLPVWVQAQLPARSTRLALRVDVVMVIDVFSQVILGYHVVNPVLRGVTRGVDEQDVWGAVVSALRPELADESCRPFVGFLPGTLRFDGAGTHGSTGDRLRKVGVEVPKLGGYKPWANGAMEATVGAIKKRCWTLKGYDEKWTVAEYEQELAFERRRRAAATMGRLPTHIPSTIDQLMTVAQLREAFGAIVHSYNHELVHSKWGTSRSERYHTYLDPSRLRSSADALSAFDITRVTVEKRGLVVRSVPMTATTRTLTLTYGEKVTVRVDPLLRGCFVEEQGLWHFFPTLAEWSRGQHPADVARGQHATAQHFSRLAREAREQYQEDVLGPEGAAIANAVAERTLSAKRSRRDTRADEGSALDALVPATKKKRNAKAPAPPPWEVEGPDPLAPADAGASAGATREAEPGSPSGATSASAGRRRPTPRTVPTPIQPSGVLPALSLHPGGAPRGIARKIGALLRNA